MSRADSAGQCLDCRHFCNDPVVIERTFPGLTAMGSAYADVRANDGLCARHGVYLGLNNGCAEFDPQPRPRGRAGGVVERGLRARWAEPAL